MTNVFDNEPNSSPSIKVYKLVFPFVQGDGLDFSDITLFYEGVLLSPGNIIRTDQDDLLHINKVIEEEDFFDKMTIAKATLLMNNANDKISPNVKSFVYMYSAYSK